MKSIWFCLVAFLSGCGLCVNDVVQEASSPDNRYVATAFIRNCGATTDFSPQVHLRKTGKKLANKGNVFIGYHSDFIKLEWVSSTKLVISSDCNVEMIEKKFKDVTVTFREMKRPNKMPNKAVQRRPLSRPR